MGLPEDSRTPWPPKAESKLYEEMGYHAAWYSGDPARLAKTYGAGTETRPGRPNSLRQRIAGYFWGRRGVADPMQEGGRLQMHVPLPGDIAATSADLLFSEPPTFEIPDAHADPITLPEVEDPAEAAERELQLQADNATRSEAIAAQDRLDEIVEEGGFHNALLEMAELQAALGGVYLRPVWDRELAPFPLLGMVGANEAAPEFRFGILTAVTFWREVERDGNKILRHLERHERGGVIFHGLFETSDEKVLGRRVDLGANESTKELIGELTGSDYIEIVGWPDALGPMVRYIPNIRPNRRYPQSYQGRSDFQGGEKMYDALDETWTSWMRDIRLGVARILVAREFLEQLPGNPNQGTWFNLDREIFTPLEMDPATKEKSEGIKPQQFEIRVEEHSKTARDITREAVEKAGYAAQTFTPQFEGTAESGTARRMRERKSFMTKAKKERYIRSPVCDILEMVLWLDSNELGNNTPVLRPRMSFGDAVGEGPREVAETVEIMNRARAISVKTGIAMVHPDWSSEQVAAEAELVLAEQGARVPSFELPEEE